METEVKLLSRTRSLARTLAAVTTVMLAVGCAHGSRSSQSQTEGPKGSQTTQNQAQSNEPFGPPTPQVVQSTPFGPEPVRLKPMTLVFGPGVAHGYAYVGAIRALNELKIPIAAVYGMEMGSLVAALYSMSPSINQFEWGLLRFKDELFSASSNVISKFFETGQRAERLQHQLEVVFGNKKIEDARIPLRIAFQPKNAALPTVVQTGLTRDVLRLSLAIPGVLPEGTWERAPAVAAQGSASAAFLSQEAKGQGGNPVVLIDAGDQSIPVGSADLVIHPDLSGIKDTDFSKKTDIAFRGKKAVEEHADELRKLVGLQ